MKTVIFVFPYWPWPSKPSKLDSRSVFFSKKFLNFFACFIKLLRFSNFKSILLLFAFIPPFHFTRAWASVGWDDGLCSIAILNIVSLGFYWNAFLSTLLDLLETQIRLFFASAHYSQALVYRFILLRKSDRIRSGLFVHVGFQLFMILLDKDWTVFSFFRPSFLVHIWTELIFNDNVITNFTLIHIFL